MKRLPYTSPQNSERGQELIEFAFTLIPLMMMLTGILDLGRVAYTLSAMHNAAREGARLGVIGPADSEAIRNEVIERAVGIAIQPDDVVVEFLDLYANVPGEDTVQISVAYDFQIVTPLISNLFGGSGTQLATQASMRMEK